MSCLPRAIALKRILVRRGYDAKLNIGLARTNPPMGHAWVSLGNQVLLDDPAVRITYGFVLRDETLAALAFASSTRPVFPGVSCHFVESGRQQTGLIPRKS
jgi:hypothetical protein